MGSSGYRDSIAEIDRDDCTRTDHRTAGQFESSILAGIELWATARDARGDQPIFGSGGQSTTKLRARELSKWARDTWVQPAASYRSKGGQDGAGEQSELLKMGAVTRAPRVVAEPWKWWKYEIKPVHDPTFHGTALEVDLTT